MTLEYQNLWFFLKSGFIIGLPDGLYNHIHIFIII